MKVRQQPLLFFRGQERRPDGVLTKLDHLLPRKREAPGRLEEFSLERAAEQSGIIGVEG